MQFTDKIVITSCVNIHLTLNGPIVILWYLKYNIVANEWSIKFQ